MSERWACTDPGSDVGNRPTPRGRGIRCRKRRMNQPVNVADPETHADLNGFRYVSPIALTTPGATSAETEGTPRAPGAEVDPLIGRSLNETYLVEGLIGQGGVGRVYRARHTRIRTKLFALKVLHPEHSRDAEQLARFQQEAEAAATLSHPHVVGVFDVGRTDDGYSYLACELLSGLDLDQYLEKQGRLDAMTTLQIGLQVCEALEAAHAQNIVHRDLKPQNVFLLAGPDGAIPRHPDVKLLDFGLSRFLDHADTQLTKTGSLLGTPAFMAPEQAMGNRGDHRVDVYGVGVILFAAVTGQAPFLADNLMAMLVSVMTEEAPRPRKIVPDIPESFELLIQRAMAKEPDHRYQTIGDVRAALDSVLTETRAALGQTRPPPRGPMESALFGTDDREELRTSRPRLLFFGFSFLLTCFALLTSAVSGLELFVGPIQLSRTELILVAAGISGTLAMPAALALKRFRVTIWSNSARVMNLLGRLRSALFAGLIAYGASIILIRFADDFLSRFGDSPLLGRSPGVGFAGFTWVVPIIAVIAGAISYFKRRALEGPGGSRLRPWLGVPLSLLLFCVSGGLLALGVQWRAAESTAPIPARSSESDAAASAPEAGAPIEDSRPEPLEIAEPALASDAELARAMALGVDGLLPLSEQYPEDPRVLEPLLLAFASRATGLADAMVTAKRLLRAAPEKRDSETLGVIVMRAAKTSGSASELALELMKGGLGSAGADLLYQLEKSGTKSAPKAKEALHTKEVLEAASPALRILLELTKAESCEARLPLLERAKSLGDERTVSLLASLTKGSKTGCGKWKNRPCVAACKDQAKAYWGAIDAIQARRAGSNL